MNIKIGTKVRIIPFEDIKTYGLPDDLREVDGFVSYINEPHKWFSVTYGKNGLKKSYKFSDIGVKVRICDCDEQLIDGEYIPTGARKTLANRTMSLNDYILYKIDILRDLAITPSKKEIEHLHTLDSEEAIDAAVRTYMKKRWYKNKKEGVI